MKTRFFERRVRRNAEVLKRKELFLNESRLHLLPSRKTRREKKTNTFVAHKPAAKWKKISLFLLNFPDDKKKEKKSLYTSPSFDVRLYVGETEAENQKGGKIE